MIGLAILVLAASEALILDARPANPGCHSSKSDDDVLVCGPGTMARTRLPVKIEGQPAILLIEPGGPNDFQCNPAIIARAKISSRGVFPLGNVGPEEITGGYSRISAIVAGRQTSAMVRWSSRPAVSGADCVTGPLALAQSNVHFVLGRDRPGSVRYDFPFHSPSYGQSYAAWPAGRHRLAVRFELDHDKTVLTAPSTRALATDIG